jgi:hypothetical protein
VKKAMPAKVKKRAVKPKLVPAKAKRRRVAMPAWWNCAEARARAVGKSRAQLAALEVVGRTFGYVLTEEQKGVAKACLGFS